MVEQKPQSTSNWENLQLNTNCDVIRHAHRLYTNVFFAITCSNLQFPLNLSAYKFVCGAILNLLNVSADVWSCSIYSSKICRTSCKQPIAALTASCGWHSGALNCHTATIFCIWQSNIRWCFESHSICCWLSIALNTDCMPFHQRRSHEIVRTDATPFFCAF